MPVGGGTFSLLSLDLQEGLFSTPPTTSILVTGFFAGGGSVSQTFTLDGISSTFQTFYPSEFTGHEKVTLAADARGMLSVDNLILPEPGAVLLFASAPVLLRRRQRW